MLRWRVDTHPRLRPQADPRHVRRTAGSDPTRIPRERTVRGERTVPGETETPEGVRVILFEDTWFEHIVGIGRHAETARIRLTSIGAGLQGCPAMSP